MTNTEILAAAFRVWGRESYRKMSLTDLAAELGVTKPALYRHFKDKDALLEAMRSDFFDRYAKAMRLAFPAGLPGRAASDGDLLGLVEALVRFFGSGLGDLAFVFARILRFPDAESVFARELSSRGLSAEIQDKASSPARTHMAVGSGFFLVAFFHMKRCAVEPGAPIAQDIDGLVAEALRLVGQGLRKERGPEAANWAGLALQRYQALEALARLSQEETATPDGLLPAVAAVVADVGSWRASMEMVAKRSGLSKSGLYSHFKSREDMLCRLFSVEFERATQLLAERASKVSDPYERLYLLMATASEYLLARPDILVALDWMRMQRFEASELMPKGLLDLFGFLSEPAAGLRLIEGSMGATVRWILFMTIHLLMSGPKARDPQASYAPSLRVLHAFVLGGLGGMNP